MQPAELRQCLPPLAPHMLQNLLLDSTLLRQRPQIMHVLLKCLLHFKLLEQGGSAIGADSKCPERPL